MNQDPTFRLEAVVHTKDEMSDFEGPLTLILQLLAKNKIEIRDISISDILEQYLQFLDSMEDVDLETSSEFVAMASQLVYIKTRMLLTTGEEEVSELEELITSLEKLKNRDTAGRIRTVTGTLGDMYRRGAGYIVKPPEPLEAPKEYRYSHDREDLLKALCNVFRRADGETVIPVPQKRLIPKRIVYPVGKKSEEILRLLTRYGVMDLNTLICSSKGRSEAVAAFVAVLELCREGKLFLSGEDDETILTISYPTDGDTAENGNT